MIQIPPGATIPAATTTTIAAATPGGATATTAPAATIPDAGDNCGEGEYTIVEGDYEGKVASNFDVTVEALRAANASTSRIRRVLPRSGDRHPRQVRLLTRLESAADR